MDSNELTKCGSFLPIKIYYYDISDGNTECSKQIDNQGEILSDVLHIYLVLDNNHCNAISSADSLLCFILNADKKNSDLCTFKYDVQDNESLNLWKDYGTRLCSKYKTFE